MEAIALGLVIVFGLVIGSFLNVCIYRLPRGESIAAEPSHCPRCGHRLGPRDLVPVLSFLWLRGRCRYCGGRISPRYAVIELLTALLFMVVWLRFGWSAAFIKYSLLSALLLVVAAIDLEHQLIPNRLVLIALAWGLVWQTLQPELTWPTALAGTALGGGVLFLLALVSRGGMGGGDIKLMVVLGFILGPAPTILALFAAFLTGSVVGVGLLAAGKVRRRDPVPFGPFLVLGTYAAVLYGQEIIGWYLRLGR